MMCTPYRGPCHPCRESDDGGPQQRPVYRSFRLYSDGSLYAEAEPWDLGEADVLATDGGSHNVRQSQWLPREDSGLGRRVSRSLHQADGRYPTTSTQYWPNNAVVQMYFTTIGTAAEGCSGTWVSGYDILTAAHCLTDWSLRQPYSDFRVRAGEGQCCSHASAV